MPDKKPRENSTQTDNQRGKRLLEIALMLAVFMLVKGLLVYFYAYSRIKAASECLLNLLPTQKDKKK